MRSPAFAYRDDLIAYRAELASLQAQAPAIMKSQEAFLQTQAVIMQAPAQAPAKAIAQATTQAAAHSALAIAIIDRWMKHKQADRIWNEIAANVPAGFSLTASAVAGRVIQYRLYAGRLIEAIDREPVIAGKLRIRAKRHFAQDTAEADAAFVFERAIRRNTQRLRARALRRERTAPRTWFIAQWSAHFKELCGKPLDSVVCFLTEIAFNDPTVTPDMVRAASQPSARKARQGQNLTSALDPQNRS